MKAILISEYGAKPQITDIAAPTPRPDQVLVQQKATSLNPVDPGRASGALKHVFPLQFPFIPGGEIVGTILAVGANVSGFQPGQEVAGFNGVGGGYAEQAVVDANRLALRPKGVSVEEAAASLLVGRTAVQALQLMQLTPGQTCFMQGGAGGVGVMAIQLAKAAGARVLVSASPAQAESLRQLGADDVVDRDGDIGAAIGQVDAFFDLLGGEALARSYSLIKQGGVLVTANQPPDKAQCEAKGIRGQQVISDCTGSGIAEVLAMLDSGRLKPVIQGEQSLWDLNHLWQRPSPGVSIGKVVYRVAE